MALEADHVTVHGRR